MNRKTKRMIASSLSGGIILSNLPSNIFANTNNYLHEMQVFEDNETLKDKNDTEIRIKNTWMNNFTSMPNGGRTHFSSAVINEEIYVISGIDNNGDYSTKVQSYNPILNEWNDKSDIPIALKGSSAIAIGSKIYCIGGSTKDGVFSNNVLIYDSITNTWDTSKSNMLIARENLSIACIKGKLYAMGGRNQSGVVKTVEVYDPNTDVWQYKQDMVVAREKFTTQAVGDKIYIIAGFNDYDGVLKNIEEYDVEKNISVYKEDMPTGKVGLSSVIMGGKIYCIGGEGFDNKTYVYDTEFDFWESKSRIPTPRANLGSGLINGVIYAIGGEGGSNLVEGYVVSTKSAPKIEVNDKTVYMGDPYNPLDGVSAYDGDGNNITGYVNILLDTVDNTSPGVYNVIYEVEDSDGITTTKEIKVTVKTKSHPVIEAYDRYINVGDSFDAKEDVFAIDRYGKDLTPFIIHYGNVDVTKPGKYKIKYVVVDEFGIKADKEITVTVKESLENTYINIKAKNKTVIIGSNIDLLEGVTAKNIDGIDLTNEIKVETNLDTSKEGTYIATYSVYDEEYSAFKTVTINVVKRSSLNTDSNEENKSRIITQDERVVVGNKIDYLKDVVAKDITGNDLTQYLLVTNDNVDFNTSGKYSVTYVVLDSQGERITKVRNIDVIADNKIDELDNIKDYTSNHLKVLSATVLGLYILNRRKYNNKKNKQ